MANVRLKLHSARSTDKEKYIVYYVVDKGFRKYIMTGLKIEPRFWDDKSIRIKPTYKLSPILNHQLIKFKDKVEQALAKWETNQWNRHQVIAFLKGESGIESIDEYIEKDIKSKRTSATHRDYKNAWRMIKKYSGFKVDEPLPFSVVNFTMLDKARRAMMNEGLRNDSINGYMRKLRAVMNDAHDNQVTYEPLTLSRKLSLPKQKRQVSI